MKNIIKALIKKYFHSVDDSLKPNNAQWNIIKDTNKQVLWNKKFTTRGS